MLLGCSTTLILTGCATAAAAVVRLSPTDDCESVVSASPAGTTFLFAPGLYREQQITPRDGDIFAGDSADPGAVVLSGARVIDASRIEQRGTQLFAAANRSETAGQLHGECDATHPRCNYPSDLFFDGLPLLHVNNSADVNRSGTWFFDYENHEILFADSPAGHTVEIGVSRRAFGNSKAHMAANVTIANMTVQMYAIPAQMGAIGDQFPGVGWEVNNVLSTLNHGVGAVVGRYGRILTSRLIKNGQQGAHGGGDGVQVVGCEIAYNNFAGFSTGWEAGAGKFCAANTVLRGNYVHNNIGRGLWADISAIGMTYADNIIVNNTHEGIAHEISYSAVIENNTVCFNGGAQDVWLWGSQIVVQNSRSVVVRNNTIVVGGVGNGIGIIFQNRGNGTYGPRASINNTLEGNTLFFLDAHGRTGGVSDCESTAGVPSSLMYSNTTIGRNIYYFNSSEQSPSSQARFVWNGKQLHFSDWQAAGNDVHGSAGPLQSAVVPAACYAH